MIVATRLDEALGVLWEKKENVTVLGGGTDLFVAARLHSEKRVFQDTVLFIKEIPQLLRIDEDGKWIRIGAACSIAEVSESPTVRKYAPLLAEAANKIASPQIRNMGTLGGNVMNASPAADGLTALICLEAKAILACAPDGKPQFRSLPVSELVVGPRRTGRKAAELLVGFTVPKYPECKCRFEKVGVRAAMAIAVASVALQKDLDGKVHIALGSMGPRTIKSRQAEAEIQAGRPEKAVELLLECCTPISDIRGSAEYRALVTKNLLDQVLNEI